MTHPIVVAVALREDDEAPLALARVLSRLSGAPLELVSVYPHDSFGPLFGMEYVIEMREDAARRLEALADTLRDEHTVATRSLQGSRAGAIQEVAEATEALAIVVGSSHRGSVGRVLAGDVAAGLLHGSPCPVVVVPRGYTERPLGPVGVAFVASDEGREAIGAAAGFAQATGSELRVYSVVDFDVYSAAAAVPNWLPAVPLDTDQVDERARAAARSAAPAGAVVEILHGSAVAELAGVSGRLGLLVCGSRGYGPLRSAVAGSVSRGLARSCACPLLLVQRRNAPHVAALWSGAGDQAQG